MHFCKRGLKPLAKTDTPSFFDFCKERKNNKKAKNKNRLSAASAVNENTGLDRVVPVY